MHWLPSPRRVTFGSTTLWQKMMHGARVAKQNVRFLIRHPSISGSHHWLFEFWCGLRCLFQEAHIANGSRVEPLIVVWIVPAAGHGLRPSERAVPLMKFLRNSCDWFVCFLCQDAIGTSNLDANIMLMVAHMDLHQNRYKKLSTTQVKPAKFLEIWPQHTQLVLQHAALSQILVLNLPAGQISGSLQKNCVVAGGQYPDISNQVRIFTYVSSDWCLYPSLVRCSTPTWLVFSILAHMVLLMSHKLRNWSRPNAPTYVFSCFFMVFPLPISTSCKDIRKDHQLVVFLINIL